MVSSHLFLGSEKAAKDWRYSHHRKEISGDEGTLHRLRLAGSGQYHSRKSTVAIVCSHIFKRLVLELENFEIPVQQTAVFPVLGICQQQEAAGISVPKRTQKDGLYHTEDRGVGGDANREREDGNS